MVASEVIRLREALPHGSFSFPTCYDGASYQKAESLQLRAPYVSCLKSNTYKYESIRNS